MEWYIGQFFLHILPSPGHTCEIGEGEGEEAEKGGVGEKSMDIRNYPYLSVLH